MGGTTRGAVEVALAGAIFGEHHGGGDCGAGRRGDEEGQPPTGLPRS